MTCPGCFQPKPDTSVCPHCGYDESLKRSPLVLPHHTPLNHGHYRVGRVLGRPGGFGITYLGWDERLETKVAIKEYLPRDLAGRELDQKTVAAHSREDAENFSYGLGKFLEEARTLARLDHPNLVRVRDFFEEHGTAYLVMDYYPGLTLAEYLSRQPGGKIGEEQAIGVLLPILDGLREVHAKGFLHRDIKPQNIYLTSGNRPILLDFGAARQAMGEHSRSLSVVLSEGYAPIEQYQRNGKQGPWTDIYGAAATLYTMVTGQTPPAATDRIDQAGTLPRLEQLSPRTALAIHQGMAPNPDQRTASVTHWQQLLLETPTPQTDPGATRRAADLPEPAPESAGAMICPACGKNNEATYAFCSACGRPMVSVASPALWNPVMVAWFGLFMALPLAIFLHARNWGTLGETDRKKSTMRWFYASLPLFTALIPASNITPEGVGAVNLLALSFWYFLAAKPQAAFIRRKFGDNYPRKGFAKPVLIAFLAFLGWFAILFGGMALYHQYSQPDAPSTSASEPSEVRDDRQGDVATTTPEVTQADQTDPFQSEAPDVLTARRLAQEASRKAQAAARQAQTIAGKARAAAAQAQTASAQAQTAAGEAKAASERARAAQAAAREAGEWDGSSQYGIWKDPEGERYEGEWRNGKPNGHGVYTWPNGQRYEGGLLNGERSGHGVIVIADGQRYEGEWKKDKHNGHGVYTWPDGGRQEGSFLNGELSGHGIYTWPDGGRYEGEWNGDRNGYGIWVSPNGQRYEGEWKKDKFNGHGVYTWPDGERHEGDFLNDEATGHGVRIYPNGQRYEGALKKNKREGQGALLGADGRVLQAGRWHDDAFVE